MAVSLDLTDNTSPWGTYVHQRCITIIITPAAFIPESNKILVFYFRVHYRDKNTTAHRLALSGLAVAYKKTGFRYKGPLPTSHKLDSKTLTITIEYDNNIGDIYIKNATAATGFDVSH